jgi:hypothetical protein
MKTRGLLLTLVCLSAAAPVSGQSLFNAAGLGVPIEALDGRARALGNVGVGLRGGSFIPTDPAALGRLVVSTGVMAAQPSWVDYESEQGVSGKVQGTRFPLLGIAYPLLGGMMSVQVGSFLDQSYQATSVGEIDFGLGPVPTTDEFEQDGSVSNLNFGFARMVGSQVSVGMTLGRYAGSVIRTLTRTYGDEQTQDVDDYVEQGEWTYRGHSFTAGVAADLGPAVRASLSVQVPTALNAESTDETRGADRSYDLPIQYRVGASALVGSGLVVTGSMLLADWSGAQDDLVGVGRAANSNSLGLGIEFSRARLWGKDAPIRFGYRQTGLPFSFDDGGTTERVIAGGFGLALSRSGGITLAGVDLAIERGRRSGGGLTENFWRATISLLASGV